jgi:hypothetical protein
MSIQKVLVPLLLQLRTDAYFWPPMHTKVSNLSIEPLCVNYLVYTRTLALKPSATCFHGKGSVMMCHVFILRLVLIVIYYSQVWK